MSFAIKSDQGVRVEQLEHQGQLVTLQLRLVEAPAPIPEPVVVEPGLLDKVQELALGLMLPVAGTGVHVASMVASEAIGVDANSLEIGAMALGAAALCGSATIRRVTLGGVRATFSLSLDCLRGIGHISERVAAAAPLLAGTVVTCVTLHGMRELGAI